LASLFFMKKMGDIAQGDTRISSISKEKAWKDETQLSESFKENVFIKHLSGPLFFGFTSEFVNLSKQIPKTASIVIIRMDKVPYVDQSGLFALEDVFMDLIDKEIEILIIGTQSQPRYLMKTIGIIGKLIPEENIFERFTDCKSFVISKQAKITA
ncbi:MAG: STAS domain-containing protein, partial [Flavobacteriaceae bacterium]